jgi:hypothetical protein
MKILVLNIIILALSISALAVQFFIYKKRKNALNKMQIKWPESKLKEVYKDALGNKWFTFENPLRIPAYRGVNAEVMINQADMCMDAAMLTKYINSIQHHLDKGRLTTAFMHFERMKERANMLGEQTTLLNLAKTFFLLEGEDPQKNSADYDKLKEQIWKEDKEARDFFLLAAFNLINDASGLSEKDILNYLNQAMLENPA